MPAQDPQNQISQPVAHTKSSLYDLFYASKAKKTYTNLGISLILIIVFLVFALIPTIQTIGTVQEKIVEYEKLNSAVSQKIVNAKNLSKQSSTSGSNGVKDEVTFLNKTFVSEYNLLPVYDNYFKRAEQNNLKITSIVPRINPLNINDGTNRETISNPPSDTGYQLSLTLEGQKMADVIKFIKSIEGYQDMPLLSRVKSISVSDQLESTKVTVEQTQSNANLTTSQPTVLVNLTTFVYLDSTRSTTK